MLEAVLAKGTGKTTAKSSEKGDSKSNRKEACPAASATTTDSQVKNYSPGYMDQAPSRGHEASPQSGLGVGCKLFSSSKKSPLNDTATAAAGSNWLLCRVRATRRAANTFLCSPQRRLASCLTHPSPTILRSGPPPPTPRQRRPRAATGSSEGCERQDERQTHHFYALLSVARHPT